MMQVENNKLTFNYDLGRNLQNAERFAIVLYMHGRTKTIFDTMKVNRMKGNFSFDIPKDMITENGQILVEISYFDKSKNRYETRKFYEFADWIPVGKKLESFTEWNYASSVVPWHDSDYEY